MATEDITKELNQLRSDITDLKEDMASLVGAMRTAGIEQGRQFYDRAYEKARRTGESVRDKADEAYGAFGRGVEERPLTSVLAAFGTGFVVGMLLDHRHHH
jgi:ElaB/YqjD/DUF883 family membrane-anchored ribosome-binding protein